jgi:hypothetical protein
MFATHQLLPITSKFTKQFFSIPSRTINCLLDMHKPITLLGTSIGGISGIIIMQRYVNNMHETKLSHKVFHNLFATFFGGGIGCITGGLFGYCYPITIPVCILTTIQHYANKPVETDVDIKN